MFRRCGHRGESVRQWRESSSAEIPRETARIRLLRTPRRGPFLPAEPSRQLPNDRGDRGDRGFREPEIARGERRSGRRSKTLLEQRFRKSLRTLERGQGNPEPGATVANAGRNVVQEQSSPTSRS
jgi:hypothetical protein